jgi:hypothetical protein
LEICLLAAAQRIQLCAVLKVTGVVLDSNEDWQLASGLGLAMADYAAFLAWAVAVAKNLGLAVSTQEGSYVLALSGVLPQLDMAITTAYVENDWFRMNGLLGECLDTSMTAHQHMLMQHPPAMP